MKLIFFIIFFTAFYLNILNAQVILYQTVDGIQMTEENYLKNKKELNNREDLKGKYQEIFIKTENRTDTLIKIIKFEEIRMVRGQNKKMYDPYGQQKKMIGTHFPELHFGLPKQLSNGDYITNHNARYIAQSIMSQAEQLTDAYQSINPNSTALQLKTYFLQKMQQISAQQGGTVSISAPMGWNGQLQPHQTYFITSSWECE